MRETRIAEWLLGRFSDRGRAASMVGDLAETAALKGRAWFWRSYAGVLAAFAWRPVGGFLLVLAGWWWGARYSGGLYLGDMATLAPYGDAAGKWQEMFVSWVTSAGAMSWTIFLYSAVRFGLKDRTTRLSAGFGIIGMVTAWFWWVSVVPTMAAAALIVLAGYSISSAPGRRGLSAIGLLWLTLPLVRLVSVTVFISVTRHYLHDATLPRWLFAVWFAACFAATAVFTCVLCNSIHSALNKGSARTVTPA
jgi:hypothetical protein